MKVWIYGKDEQDIERIKGQLDPNADKLIGTSIKAEAGSTFPDSRLIGALCAAMRREIDMLIVSDVTLLGDSQSRRREIEKTFKSYWVFVRRIEA